MLIDADIADRTKNSVSASVQRMILLQTGTNQYLLAMLEDASPLEMVSETIRGISR